VPVERWRHFYTAPDDNCEGAILAAAGNATVSLHVLIYALTMRSLLALIKQKKAEGLIVGVVADLSQSIGHAERPLLQDLVDNGVPVTITTSPTGAIMHTKALLIDHELGTEHNASHVVYGSMNLSVTGPKQANFVVIENDPTMCDYLLRAYHELEQFGKAHVPQLVPHQP
jgi:phosphatidylserine/phosphatidylglycerophosphate/cardiolipin synthase-like enzyme